MSLIYKLTIISQPIGFQISISIKTRERVFSHINDLACQVLLILFPEMKFFADRTLSMSI